MGEANKEEDNQNLANHQRRIYRSESRQNINILQDIEKNFPRRSSRLTKQPEEPFYVYQARIMKKNEAKSATKSATKV